MTDSCNNVKMGSHAHDNNTTFMIDKHANTSYPQQQGLESSNLGLVSESVTIETSSSLILYTALTSNTSETPEKEPAIEPSAGKSALVIENKPSPKPKIACSWEELPYEIREKIFRQVAIHSQDEGPYFRWKGVIPPLVVALRTLPVSYGHVLEWYGKTNAYIEMVPEKPCFLNICNMRTIEASVIKKIYLNISGIFQLSRSVPKLARRSYQINFGDTFLKPTIFTQDFKYLPDLREVHLDVYHDRLTPADHICAFVTEWPFWLQGCPQLSTVVVSIPKLLRTWSRLCYENLLILKLSEAVVKKVSNKLGVQGVDVSDKYSADLGFRCDTWRWEAEKDSFMDWTQELGWSSRFDKNLKHYNFFDDNSRGNLKFLGGTFVLKNFDH